jgi:hypothetical protein
MTTKKTVATPVKAAEKKVAVKSSVKKAPLKKVSAMAKAAAKPVLKPSRGVAAKPAAKKPKKEHKVKVVRDSFTMPQNEYQKIAEIKETCLKAGLPVKKSEVLRAGLKALAELNAAQLKRAMAALEKIKTGRPKKH